MIGLGPHEMGAGDWIFLAALQLSLVLLAIVAVWLAVRATRPGSGR
jgi:hypothetical protein